jgi:SAM-dependent methyltransferase
VGGYDEDLAVIHDAGWLDVASSGAAALIDLLRRRGRTGGLVVELGCGSGASSRILTDAGYEVIGIDASPAMIDLARGRAPDAEFRLGSFVDAEIPPCDAVTAFGEVLNYLFDERNSTETLGALFARVHGSLRPGGIFLFDVAGPGRGGGRVWRASDEWAVLVDAEEKDLVITRHITTFRLVDGAYRRNEETHRQQVLPSGTIAGLLRDAGFGVRILRTYGEAAVLAPHCRAFLATKR